MEIFTSEFGVHDSVFVIKKTEKYRISNAELKVFYFDIRSSFKITETNLSD